MGCFHAPWLPCLLSFSSTSTILRPQTHEERSTLGVASAFSICLARSSCVTSIESLAPPPRHLSFLPLIGSRKGIIPASTSTSPRSRRAREQSCALPGWLYAAAACLTFNACCCKRSERWPKGGKEGGGREASCVRLSRSTALSMACKPLLPSSHNTPSSFPFIQTHRSGGATPSIGPLLLSPPRVRIEAGHSSRAAAVSRGAYVHVGRSVVKRPT